jgi:hypothetical protein
MINRCLVSNLWLKLCMYTLQLFELIDEYKSKFGGVWQKIVNMDIVTWCKQEVLS